MQFDLEPGDFVINPKNKEWGIGQIQSIIREKVTVNFQNSGKQVLNANYIVLEKVKKLYNIDPLVVNKEVEKQTGCNAEGLEKILSKGRGAYYSSGSRPNQTAESWAVARLASAITGGPASAYDYHVLEEHCKKDSIALKLAKKTCKKLNKSCGKNKTMKNKKK